jgi:putative ABC transport system substrate-binding protein
MAPSIKRVAMMFNPDTAPSGGSYFLPPFETGARSLNLEPIPARVRSGAEIEMFLTSFGREPSGGLIIMPDLFMQVHRALIISLAAQNNIPAVYQLSLFAREGGLLSYGPDGADLFRRAAPYVDRILRGARPADLPVQLPIKFELVINLKAANALGLVAPQSILLRADEVIE